MSRSLNLQLPRGWYEVKGGEPHTYRRHGQGCGTLQLSLYPPVDTSSDGEEVLAKLHELLKALGIPLGTPITSGHAECAVGIMAFATFKNVQKGQLEFWLIPADVAIFASWQMGSIATAGLERAQVHEMMRTMCFEESDADEIASGEPET